MPYFRITATRILPAPVGLTVLALAAPAAALPVKYGFDASDPRLHLAQVTGPSVPSVPGGPAAPTAPSAGAPFSDESVPATPETTENIVSLVSQSAEICSSVAATYRVDCLAKEFQSIATRMPDGAGYRDAKRAIQKAGADLEALSRQNVDTSQPRVRVPLKNAAGGRTTTRPLVAIKPEVVEDTNAKALDIIDSTTTVLLRSAEKSDERAIHFQRIAQALFCAGRRSATVITGSNP